MVGARAVTDSIDVVSRLEVIFICYPSPQSVRVGTEEMMELNYIVCCELFALILPFYFINYYLLFGFYILLKIIPYNSNAHES